MIENKKKKIRVTVMVTLLLISLMLTTISLSMSSLGESNCPFTITVSGAQGSGTIDDPYRLNLNKENKEYTIQINNANKNLLTDSCMGVAYTSYNNILKIKEDGKYDDGKLFFTSVPESTQVKLVKEPSSSVSITIDVLSGGGCTPICASKKIFYFTSTNRKSTLDSSNEAPKVSCSDLTVGANCVDVSILTTKTSQTSEVIKRQLAPMDKVNIPCNSDLRTCIINYIQNQGEKDLTKTDSGNPSISNLIYTCHRSIGSGKIVKGTTNYDITKNYLCSGTEYCCKQISGASGEPSTTAETPPTAPTPAQKGCKCDMAITGESAQASIVSDNGKSPVTVGFKVNMKNSSGNNLQTCDVKGEVTISGGGLESCEGSFSGISNSQITLTPPLSCAFKKGQTYTGKITAKTGKDPACGSCSTDGGFSLHITEDGKANIIPFVSSGIGVAPGLVYKLAKSRSELSMLCCMGGIESPPVCDTKDANKLKTCLARRKELGDIKLQYKARCAGWHRWVYTMSCIGSLAYGGVGGIWLGSHSGTAFPEQALVGNEHCELCDDYGVCTQERCDILGKCKFIPNDEETGGVCLPDVCRPTSVPKVTNMKMRWFVDRTSQIDSDLIKDNKKTRAGGVQFYVNYTGTEGTTGFKPSPIGAFPFAVSDVELTVDTNQGAKCKYVIDKTDVNFSEMPNDFDNNQFYPTEQKTKIELTGLTPGINHTIYVKCQGICGQSNEAGFDWNLVRFTKGRKPDEMPPQIVRTIPDSYRQYFSDDDKKLNIEIWLDEPSTCKYSTIADNLTGNYSDMTAFGTQENDCIKSSKCIDNQQCCVKTPEGSFKCLNKYKCTHCNITIDMTNPDCYQTINWTQLSGQVQQASENNSDIANLMSRFDYMSRMSDLGLTGVSKMVRLMFRCEDLRHNMMPEPYEYMISSYPPYNMTINQPTGGLETYDREIPINVTTTRGTMCKYNATTRGMPRWENMQYIEGTEALDVEHIGKTSWLEPDSYTLWVKCRDAGGLEVTNKTTFTILRDTTPPIIIRMFGSGNDLSVETNEWAKCVYNVDDQKKCNYDFEEGQDMTSVDGYHHLTSLVKDWTYYIKCKDRFNNTAGAGSCTAIVKPYELPGY